MPWPSMSLPPQMQIGPVHPSLQTANGASGDPSMDIAVLETNNTRIKDFEVSLGSNYEDDGYEGGDEHTHSQEHRPTQSEQISQLMDEIGKLRAEVEALKTAQNSTVPIPAGTSELTGFFDEEPMNLFGDSLTQDPFIETMAQISQYNFSGNAAFRPAVETGLNQVSQDGPQWNTEPEELADNRFSNVPQDDFPENTAVQEASNASNESFWTWYKAQMQHDMALVPHGQGTSSVAISSELQRQPLTPQASSLGQAFVNDSQPSEAVQEQVQTEGNINYSYRRTNDPVRRSDAQRNGPSYEPDDYETMAQPKRRDPEKLQFEKDIRSHLKFLESQNVSIVRRVTRHEAAAFAAAWAVDEGESIAPAVSETTFRYDVQGAPRSPWNLSAGRIFTESFIRMYNMQFLGVEDVWQAFFTRLKSIQAAYRKSLLPKIQKLASLKTQRQSQRKNGRQLKVWAGRKPKSLYSN
ncbi:hypothetical protein NLJ89_g2650 [Agrocybe chaxingu]|uniref:Uncharacterized protein n=1 Tax=Agrocybe chaxingu TaxID=84603 RepID=A0A9W8K5H8_9AGAR|nr:hypothetical protein NLJ89_g2650 [Agrocybe chaxingu]